MPTRITSAFLLALVMICTGLTLIPPSEKTILLLEFLGSFHPLILHVPIGLWIGVLLILFWKTFSEDIPLQNNLLYWGSAFTILSGTLAFLTGLNLYWAGSYSRDTLLPHMYGALAFLIGVLIFTLLIQQNKTARPLWITALSAMIALSVAGHIGGVITHGDPLDKAPWVINAKKEKEALAQNAQSPSDLTNPLVFEHVVMPILEAKCISCHGTERAKGKLRMDSYAALLKGGSKGTSLVAGNAQKSSMIERVHLPLDHDEHMPPQDKPQLTPQETAFLTWWIDNGASQDLPVLQAKIPTEHAPLVQTHIGDDPAAIQRRQDKEQRNELLAIYEKISAKFPGIIIQTLQGQARFELSNASLYAMDEENLRAEIAPLIPHLVRLDWKNRPLEAPWFDLLNDCQNLAIINLNQSQITDAQVQTLIENNPHLHKLSLYGTPVTDQLAKTLQPAIANGQFTTLILGQTQLTSQARQQLKNAIPKTTIID